MTLNAPSKACSPEFRDPFANIVVQYLSSEEQRVLCSTSKIFKEICFLYFFDQTIPSCLPNLTWAHRKIANSLYAISANKKNRPPSMSSEIFKELKSPIYALYVAPDGKTILAGTVKNTIYIWDRASKQCVNTLQGHVFARNEGKIQKIILTSEGKYVIAASQDFTIRIWNTEYSSLVHGETYYLIGHSGHRSPIQTVALTPNTQQIISGSEDGKIIFWDLKSRKAVQWIKRHPKSLLTLILTRDGKFLISGATDRCIRVIDIEKNDCVREWEGHLGAVQTILLTSKENSLISGSDDCTIKEWDMADFSLIQTLKGHEKTVRTLAQISENNFLISGSDDGTIKLWDLISGACTYSFKQHEKIIRTIVWSCQCIISGSDDGTIKIKKLYPLLEEVVASLPLRKGARIALLDIKQYLKMVVNRQERCIENLLPSAIEFTAERISRLPLPIQREIDIQLHLTNDKKICISQNTPSSVQDLVEQFFTDLETLPEKVRIPLYEKLKTIKPIQEPQPFLTKKILYAAIFVFGTMTAFLHQNQILK